MKSLKLGWLLLFLAALGCLLAGSLLLGRTAISWSTMLDAFRQYDESNAKQLIVRTERLDRAVIAATTGAALAVAGALMQALTRNPLASPSVFGINSGAILFVVLGTLLLDIHDMSQLMWLGFAGAALTALCVYMLGAVGSDGMTPMKLVMAGAAMTALFASMTQIILVMDDTGFQDVIFWLSGSVSGRSLDSLLPVLPFLVAALMAAFLMSGAINVLITGEDIARGLGQRTTIVKIAMGLTVVVLAGGSVGVVGSIGFVGLVVPHLARAFTGNDYRWLIPISAVMGADLLLLADIGARFLIMPQEVPIGIMMAMIGVPFFVYIARRGVIRD
ncbi:iron ABC transporter permease [Paenibacillus sp. HB172176]|uniref:FecCD family ABC transporter permease n=1 Tax=Paenibacillus sp. HB172176 TaxID=2493690 RepID=UPI001439B036|nr:iron ABC transporter permease [Paenibacillus sp. HB172176]